MELSDCSPAEQTELAALEARLGRTFMRQRLGMEGEKEARAARHGDAGGWSMKDRLIRAGLTLSGLRGRGRRNTRNIRQVVNEVGLARLPEGFQGYTLLHLSDLHLDIDEHFVGHLIERVRGLAYDACVMTGDFRFRASGPYAPALQALSRLMAHIHAPAYAVLGNHDSIRMVGGMEAMGIRVLMNESVPLRRAGQVLHLAGIDDAHYFRTHDFHRATAGMAAGECAVLLSHSPDPYRHAAYADFGLMLSGHTHGGQICLPGGIPVLTECEAPRAFARGAWRYRQLSGYTSVGCGSSIIDVRFNCAPEVTLHRLMRG